MAAKKDAVADVKVVTFTLESGAKVTCSEDLAKTLGHKPSSRGAKKDEA